MNIYLIGMCIAMLSFLVISWLISKKVKNAEDFYVAGRKAPLILIAGSMIASYTSTGLFMGDAAEAYGGAFSAITLANMQSAGYILGAVFFGRYLRRSGAMTIPEFFGRRFCSQKMRTLSAVTAIIMMTVYLLSVIQGVGTLMNIVTGVSYNICIVTAVMVFAFISVVSGSRGVLITDTLMAGLFTLSMLVSVFFIADRAGGWFSAITTLASAPDTRELLSWAGRPGFLYGTGTDNMLWGISYGIVWCSVCAIGPWQSSRYMMAKDEHTVVGAAPIAALGVFLLQFFVCMTAVIINVLNPDLEQPSHVWIWAAMHVVPTVLGVILMTGVLSAGISSATTFLSLIGASAANDLASAKGDRSIRIGRLVMIAASVIVLVCALTNPPAIFVVMFLGGSTAASSWMPVAAGCVFSRRMTRTGAFWGMVSGMGGCFAANLLRSIGWISLPAYLDPAVIGILCNITAIIIGSSVTKVTDEERQARERLFEIPESECEEAAVKKTLRWSLFGILAGVLVTAVMLVFWVIPLLSA